MTAKEQLIQFIIDNPDLCGEIAELLEEWQPQHVLK